mgnify:FL=1
MDLFRTGGMSFEDWTRVNDLNHIPPEEKDRFLAALAALERNVALTYILNKMETEAMRRLHTLPPGQEGLDDAHRDMHALKRFRMGLQAAVQDDRVARQKAPK